MNSRNTVMCTAKGVCAGMAAGAALGALLCGMFRRKKKPCLWRSLHRSLETVGAVIQAAADSFM